MSPIGFLRSKRDFTPLDEAAAYARCHGDRPGEVTIVARIPRRPRYEVLATGEQLRKVFEERLDARLEDQVALGD